MKKGDLRLHIYRAARAFILMIALTGASSGLKAQQTISVLIEKGSLEQALNKIRDASGGTIVYNKEDVADKTVIQQQFQKKSVDFVLGSLLQGFSLTTEKKGAAFVVKKKTTEAKEQQINNKLPIEIKGRVFDEETGSGIPGATVMIGNKQIATDDNGEFTMTVADGNYTVDVSAVGYGQMARMNIAAAAFRSESLFISLRKTDSQLDQVVVTALGIKKEEKSLGYTVQKIGGEVFEKASDVNLINSMAGKVAGMSINTASELFNTSQITLRGEPPIIIIDGVSTKINYWELNHSDIESVNVLKGPAAAALYGSEGRNGAIIITTKRGKRNRTTVEVNSTFTVQPWLLTYPKTQTTFGSGNNGVYEYVDGSGAGIEGGGFNWGPKLDGRLIKQWNSPIDPVTGERIPIPWEDKTGGKGNLVKFLESGFTNTNNINLETGSDRGTFRVSLSNSNQKGMVPNTKLNITGFSMGGSYDVNERYNINTTLSYSKQNSPNYRTPGYGPHDYLYSLMFWLGSDIDLDDAKTYWDSGMEHIQQRFQQLGYYNNPYLIAYENLHTWDKNSIYGQITNNIKVIPQTLNLVVRSGMNSNSLEQTERVPKSMVYYGQKSRGDFFVNSSQFFRMNTDVILTYDKQINHFLELNAIAGFSNIYEKTKLLSARTDGLSIAGLYTLKNSMNPVINSNTILEQQINAWYANLNLRVWKPFHLSLTARNDKVSTLPINNNSFVYPSAALSYVVSDMFVMPSWIDFVKLRSSWTQVNSGWTGSVYGHMPTYSMGTYYNLPAMSLGDTLVPVDLQPSGSRTIEFGGNIAVLKNRISLDVAYYKKTEYDNIIAQAVPLSSGFTQVRANGREYERRGWEIMLNARPVVTKNLTWNLGINWSKSHRYLTQLEDGKERDGYIKLNTRVDQIYRIGLMRSPNGEVIYNASTGLPLRDLYNRYVGNFDADFFFGFQTSITYKRFFFNISIDGQSGGRYYSILPRMKRAGTSSDLDLKLMEDAANGISNYVGEGVVVTSGDVTYDFEGNIVTDTRKFAPNTQAVSYQDWAKSYYNLSASTAETYIDATYIKFRDIAFGYNIPSSVLQKTFFTGATVTLIGNNVLLLTKRESIGDDPSWKNDNLKSPTPVSIGLNINLKF